jgi:NAD(P)-dependent dehydrogenase (short-subunit alcohol dehydrogenase family)
VSLSSLRDDYRALIFGASGGIGADVVAALAHDPRCARIFAVSRAPMAASGKIHRLRFDLTEESSIGEAVAAARVEGPLDLVFVATGVLHGATLQPEKTWRALDPQALAQAFAINAIGPALIAKHALGALNREHKSVFAALSARVGSISDNRSGGWHSYRAAKTALNMLIRNFTIELAHRNTSAVCLALHPGTVDTGLSAPFQIGLPTGQLTTPALAAQHLLAVIDAATPQDSGALVGWDGAKIPY